MQYFNDSRLPKGIRIANNDFKEFVACDKNGVVQLDQQHAVEGSLTLEGAVQNYLNGVKHIAFSELN